MSTLAPYYTWTEVAAFVRRSDWTAVADMLRDMDRYEAQNFAIDPVDCETVAMLAVFGPPALLHVAGRSLGLRSRSELRSAVARACLVHCRRLWAESNWADSAGIFARVIQLAPLTSYDEAAILTFVEEAIQSAADVESSIASVHLKNDDLVRLKRRAEGVEALLGTDASVFEPTAAVLSALCQCGYHETCATIALKQALTQLHWPVLRHMGWIATSSFPLFREPDCQTVLSRRVVRLISTR